jgi:hypothetical protein
MSSSWKYLNGKSLFRTKSEWKEYSVISNALSPLDDLFSLSVPLKDLNDLRGLDGAASHESTIVILGECSGSAGDVDGRRDFDLTSLL